MRTWTGRVVALAALVAWGTPLRADERVQLTVDTSEAEAVLAILAKRAAGDAIIEADWKRLFASEPYRSLKLREAEMKRAFDDAEFERFVLSDDLLAQAEPLQRTLTAWAKADLRAAAGRVLEYLPAQARIRAKVFPVIKPKTNSFVFDAGTDPKVFLYLDPVRTAGQFENTVAHELHHIGLASVAGEAEAALQALPAPARTAAGWMGGFGEGIAMLAASGGPGVHPHASSPPEDRTRWDRDAAAFGRDLRLVEQFFLDIVDGTLAGEDAIREKGFAFFGVQGPWYTVGWKMAAVIEQRYGRAALIECMLDPRRLLATYNRAAAGPPGNGAPLWSRRLLEAVRAEPAAAAGTSPDRRRKRPVS
jgi:putative zinc-dependent peptidase DUF5700